MTDGDERPGVGAITRALLWVVGGLVLFLLAIVLTAPELVGSDPEVLRDTLGIIGIAAVPGLVLVAAAVWRVRRADARAPAHDEPMIGRNGDRPHPTDGADPTDDPDREA